MIFGNNPIGLGSRARAVASIAGTVSSSICLDSLACGVASIPRSVFICLGQEAFCALKPFVSCVAGQLRPTTCKRSERYLVANLQYLK